MQVGIRRSTILSFAQNRSLRLERNAMRVGANFCPGILHAVPAKDGLVLRIRVPGGLIRSGQLSALSELSAELSDGQIDITSRANIQLRAIKSRDLSLVVEHLTSVGMLPSREHDRVRNIIASPLAGLDSGELLDTRSLVRALDERLTADSELADLHPKFSVAIDGGGRWFSRETDDLALRAVEMEGVLYFRLAIGGLSTGLGVTIDQAVDCILETARACLRIARQFHLPVRGRRIAAVPDAISCLMEFLSGISVPCSTPNDFKVEVEWPIGASHTKQAGFVSVIPSIPLGRLQAAQALSISNIAENCNASLRLAPWRGIVLGAIPERSVSSVIAELHDDGLSLDANDGYRGLSACAGSTGCEASLTDVRADAHSLARKLAGKDAKPGWTVNISGCEKQCAMRNGATADLIATESGYSVKFHGIAVAPVHSPASAIDAAIACHATIAGEVCS
jgi:precorrin-3B synthase